MPFWEQVVRKNLDYFKGKPFDIYKFRIMFEGAKKEGPQLSSNNDKLITESGLFIRKLRLDELNQFIITCKKF